MPAVRSTVAEQSDVNGLELGAEAGKLLLATAGISQFVCNQVPNAVVLLGRSGRALSQLTKPAHSV